MPCFTQKKFGWKKIWGEIFVSTQDGMKHPEMHKNSESGKNVFGRWEKLGEKKV